MSRAFKLVLLTLAQVAAALSLAQPAQAALVTCETGYIRESPDTSAVDYEYGVGYGSCSDFMSRIDIRLTYVYCPTSTSCNSTGSNFGYAETDFFQVRVRGSISLLRGYYKVIVRTSFTLYSGQSFYGVRGDNMVYGVGGCGESSPGYWSCAYESAVFQRGV